MKAGRRPGACGWGAKGLCVCGGRGRGPRLWAEAALTGLFSQNAPNEQRQVPGLAVEARALTGSPSPWPFLVSYRYSGRGGPIPALPPPTEVWLDSGTSWWTRAPWSLWAGPEGAGPHRLKGQGSSCPLPPNPCSLLSVGPVVPVSASCCLVLKQTNSQALEGWACPSYAVPFTSAASGVAPCLPPEAAPVRVAPGLCPLWALGELGKAGVGAQAMQACLRPALWALPLPVAQGLPCCTTPGARRCCAGHRWGLMAVRLVLHPGGPPTPLFPRIAAW